ncbi:hypothetical protein EDD11_004381 [Mortierella claussenii]|nr:hypothetical protein EDD11_004381 [Mortierella claussenii]
MSPEPDVVFFQLLTCTLVIVGTFRLCGVFLFSERRSIPSKYIAICPVVAFALATTPAAAGHFDFNECGHYCWFTLVPDQPDCKVRSLWAWLCFYAWMILFLTILFGSTLFVMVRIALTVWHSQSDLKMVANQSLDYVTVNDIPPAPSSSTIDRLRSMSHSIHSKTVSLLSLGSRRRESTRSQQEREDQLQTTDQGYSTTNDGQNHDGDQRPHRPAEHRTSRASFGLDSPSLRSQGISTAAHAATVIDMGTDTQGPAPTTGTTPRNGTRGGTAVLRAKERPFLVAILRQALYPISISVSGCIQIIVDLTLDGSQDYESALDYFANAATSVQGFLFFLVFIFDPAVVQTRRYWRKYLVWKYYVEFYYSLGMPHEGREFQDQFFEKCQVLNRYGNETRFDQLTRTPPYSWSLQYDDLAMPSDFQTTYPLAQVASHVSENSEPDTRIRRPAAAHVHLTPPRDDRASSSRAIDAADGDGAGVGVFVPTSLPGTILEDDETHVESGSANSTNSLADLDRRPSKVSPSSSTEQQQPVAANATKNDYTYSFPDLSSEATLPSRSPDKEDAKIHPMITINLLPDDGSTGPSALLLKNDTPLHRDEAVVVGRDEEVGAHPSEQDTNQQMTGSRRSLEPKFRPKLLRRRDSSNSNINSGSSLQGRRSSYRKSRLPSLVPGDHTHSDLYDSEFDAGMEVPANPQQESQQQQDPTFAMEPQHSDALAFPVLSRVTTIGGGDDGIPASVRRYRAVPARSSKSSSGRGTLGSIAGGSRGASITNASVPSFGARLRMTWARPGYHTHEVVHKRYQRQFRFPRLAYLVHMAVRQIYIPSEARMPPIPNPFKRESRRESIYHRAVIGRSEEGTEGEMLPTVHAIRGTAANSSRAHEAEPRLLEMRGVPSTTASLPDPIHPRRRPSDI